jgi:hypothetical protein
MRPLGSRLLINQPFQAESLKITPDFIELLPGLAQNAAGPADIVHFFG